MNSIKIIPTLLFTMLISMAWAQQSPLELQKMIDDLNRRIDRAVVNKDSTWLKEVYADDFYFTHGTGQIDSKKSWLKYIEAASTRYTSREHDSTLVELHDNVAIVVGKLAVESVLKGGNKNSFAIKYVRVFALRKKKWLLVSHRTIKGY